MRPEDAPPWLDAGPTAVHDCCEIASVGSWVKMRNGVVNWSATASPRPATDALRFSVQLTSVPLIVDELLVIWSTQVPSEPTPLKAVVSGCCGLNGPAPMPVPVLVV